MKQKNPLKIPKFSCEYCEYITNNKKDFSKHLSTSKHKNETNETKSETKNPQKSPDHNCLCGKNFNSRTSLWRHRKTCDFENNNNQELIINPEDISNFTQIIMEVMKSNNELQKQMVELVKTNTGTIMNSHNTITNNTNTNSNNKTFNLQVFLNETCKDAMNIMDFVDSLQIQLSDLENVGRNGFVAGISDIILKNLRALYITQRPIHCSDQKREIVYVKDDNVWHNDTKEQPENQKLKKAIKYIAHKNTCLIKEWKAKYPDCGQSASRKSDLYNKIVYEAMSLDNANAEKIIKRITKEIGIDKSI